MKNLVIIALFLLAGVKGYNQTIYYDTINSGIRNTYGRLCANIDPITLGYFDTTIQLTRLSVLISGFPMAYATGTWYLDYQINGQWYSIAQDGFSFPINQNITFLQAQGGLFLALQATIKYNGRRLIISFQ